MLKKTFYLVIISIIFIFFYFVIEHYLSESNIKKINLNRLNKELILNGKHHDILKLKNDTNNVIEFNSGYNTNENTKVKKKFWELFNSK
jgi:hypothetical protein|tara:strand:+ start:181 stop:447 length:267 start_codon:yes stop_codon:yes gene_type:complete